MSISFLVKCVKLRKWFTTFHFPLQYVLNLYILLHYWAKLSWDWIINSKYRWSMIRGGGSNETLGVQALYREIFRDDFEGILRLCFAKYLVSSYTLSTPSSAAPGAKLRFQKKKRRKEIILVHDIMGHNFCPSRSWIIHKWSSINNVSIVETGFQNWYFWTIFKTKTGTTGGGDQKPRKMRQHCFCMFPNISKTPWMAIKSLGAILEQPAKLPYRPYQTSQFASYLWLMSWIGMAVLPYQTRVRADLPLNGCYMTISILNSHGWKG